jgi:hypothetical protein
MRAGDTVVFDTEGVVRADGMVVIGCHVFTLAQVNGACKKATVKNGQVKIKGATGRVITERGTGGRLRVEFAGVERRFLTTHVEDKATSRIKVRGADLPAVAGAPQRQPDVAPLRWQDGDRIVWNERTNSGPRVRRNGRWVRENGDRVGRRRDWGDADYDRMAARGKVTILRKGGVDIH